MFFGRISGFGFSCYVVVSIVALVLVCNFIIHPEHFVVHSFEVKGELQDLLKNLPGSRAAVRVRVNTSATLLRAPIIFIHYEMEGGEVPTNAYFPTGSDEIKHLLSNNPDNVQSVIYIIKRNEKSHELLGHYGRRGRAHYRVSGLISMHVYDLIEKKFKLERHYDFTYDTDELMLGAISSAMRKVDQRIVNSIKSVEWKFPDGFDPPKQENEISHFSAFKSVFTGTPFKAWFLWAMFSFGFTSVWFLGSWFYEEAKDYRREGKIFIWPALSAEDGLSLAFDLFVLLMLVKLIWVIFQWVFIFISSFF